MGTVSDDHTKTDAEENTDPGLLAGSQARIQPMTKNEPEYPVLTTEDSIRPLGDITETLFKKGIKFEYLQIVYKETKESGGRTITISLK